MALQVEIINHPRSAAHKVVKVITRGRVYAIDFAEPYPTTEEVKALWQTDRRAFRPYNEATGCYLMRGY